MEVNLSVKNCALAAERTRLKHAGERGLDSCILLKEKHSGDFSKILFSSD